MRPILFPAAETAFTSLGLGTLTDALSCIVTEERNGVYTLEMTYPVTGIHYSDLALRALILAKPNRADRPQPFRISRITRPLAGVVTVYAQHISYDLSGIPVEPFTVLTAASAAAGMATHSVVPNPFTMTTDISSASDFTVTVPASYRSLMGGTEGSLLQVYRGEYHYDYFSIAFNQHRGQDRGVTIAYGKNLTDLQQEESCEATYTAVYPYWANQDEGLLVEASPRLVPAMGTHDHTRVMMLDVTQEFDEQPTPAQVQAAGEAYVTENDIGVPAVSLTVSWAQDPGALEAVDLCDTVHVSFPAMGVTATAKVIRTVYNTLLERYEEIQIGDPRSSFAETVAQQYERLEDTNRYVIDSNVRLRKMVVDTAAESRTAIEEIGGNGAYYNLTELSQTADQIRASVSSLGSQVAAVVTDTDALLEFREATETQIRTLGYVRALTVDGQLVLVLGDSDTTHTHLKATRNRLLIGAGPDEDISTDNAAAWFGEDEGHIRTFTAEESMQLGDEDSLSWRWIREADGDLILMGV